MRDPYCLNCGEPENVALIGCYPGHDLYRCNECGDTFPAGREKESE